MIQTPDNVESELILSHPLKRFVGTTLYLSLDEVLDMVNSQHLQHPQPQSNIFLERLEIFERAVGIEFKIRLGFTTVDFQDEASMMEFYLRWLPTK